MQLGCVSAWSASRRRRTTVIALGSLALLTAACASGGSPTPTTSGNSTTSTATGAGATATGTTVWLCRPGQADDPCTTPLDATVVPTTGARTTLHARPAVSSPFDCFYVYPTVSSEPGDNADLTVQPAERGAAIAQASRFSPLCEVWAPMYRQRTESSLAKGLGADPRADAVAYASLLAAWKDYLAHDNDGRPIIFIGHSQGAAMLIRLLAGQVDPNPALRARTVLAILAGGNVTVPTGATVGATFAHLPLCTASGQSGCVIAFSTFPSEPPSDALFGRPGQGVSLQSGQTATNGLQVACVNPAALAGGAADLSPYFLTATSSPPPPAVTTPWVTYPQLYSAGCRTGGGASWLQVSTLDAGGRPVVDESLGPQWGYHLDDVNLTLGNLVADASAAESAFTAHR